MSLLKLLEQYAARDDATIPIREDDVRGKKSSRPETALFAATNLDAWETDEPHHYDRDVGIAGTAFVGSIRTTTPGFGTRCSWPRRPRARHVFPPRPSTRCGPGSTSSTRGRWSTSANRRSGPPASRSIRRAMRRRGSNPSYAPAALHGPLVGSGRHALPCRAPQARAGPAGSRGLDPGDRPAFRGHTAPRAANSGQGPHRIAADTSRAPPVGN